MFPLTPVDIARHGATGGPRVKSGTRRIVTRWAKLFVNLLLATTKSFLSFHNGYKTIVILFSSAVFCTSTTYAADFKNHSVSCTFSV
jgi:hypothetical protein